jgi:hypothetical protein
MAKRQPKGGKTEPKEISRGFKENAPNLCSEN